MLRKLLASDDPRDERIVHLLDLVATRAFAIGREYDGFEKHVIGQFAGLMAKRDDERRKRRP
jgi:hypothetical protein